MIDIVCWKWKPHKEFRTEFTAYHVNVLYSMVKKNTTIPFRFNCITDDPKGISPEIRIIPLWNDCKDLKNPNNQKKPSCYRRLKAFSKAVPFEDRIISIDLDCVIVGNIDDILSRQEDFICLKGTARKTAYNGGLWSLKVGTRLQVWDTFDPVTSPNLTIQAGLVGSDQGWISYVLGPNEKTYSGQDGVYCFREDFVKPKNIKLPSNAKIVMFQGGKDPWDISIKKQYPWININYKLGNESPTVFPPDPKPKPEPKPMPKPKIEKPEHVTCITFLWGNYPYDFNYVNKLFRAINKYLSIPHTNICFTNIPKGIDKSIEIRPLTNEWMFGNLKKTIQYDPKNGLSGRILSFDVDNVIMGSLDMFAEYNGEFAICEAVAPNRRGKPGGNFMSFVAGYGVDTIWKKLNENYDFYKKKTKGSERYLYDWLIKKMDFWPKEAIVSYRHHVKKGKVHDWSKVRMVWCHGSPQLHEIKDPIIHKHWK